MACTMHWRPRDDNDKDTRKDKDKDYDKDKKFKSENTAVVKKTFSFNGISRKSLFAVIRFTAVIL